MPAHQKITVSAVISCTQQSTLSLHSFSLARRGSRNFAPGRRHPSFSGPRRSGVNILRTFCSAADPPAIQQAGPPETKPLTFVEAQSVAAARGLNLGVLELGPFYRITCRDGEERKAPIVAVSSGFTLPFLKLMHCDTLQVFLNKLSDRNGLSAKQRGVGLGLLMCGAVLAYGADLGCTNAEILAINDDDYSHQRLVKYYRRMGFEKILEVGNNGLSDLPHLLVWGGAGTRMDISPQTFLSTWSNAIRTRR